MRLDQHVQVVGRHIGGNAAAGHQDEPARRLGPFFKGLPAQAIDFFGGPQVDQRRFDVPGNDAGLSEVMNGIVQVHFVAEADDSRVAHGNLPPKGQVLVLLAADVAVDMADAGRQGLGVQLLLIGKNKVLEKLGRNHLVGGRRRRHVDQEVFAVEIRRANNRTTATL